MEQIPSGDTDSISAIIDVFPCSLKPFRERAEFTLRSEKHIVL
jgi:hypothetical protein